MNESDASLIESLQQIAKISTDTPEKMRLTRKSAIIQIFVMILAIMITLIYQLYSDMVAVLYSGIFLALIAAIYIAYYEVDWNAYKLSLASFRGFCILMAIITNWLCDILRQILCSKQDKEPFLTTMMDNIGFTILTMLIFAADSSPRVFVLVRFLGPFSMIVFIALIIITEYTLIPDLDATLFTIYYGSLTINEVEKAAKLQIIWYSCTFLWAVPRDPKHHYFVFLDDRIKVKTMIPKRHIHDATRDTLRKYLMHSMWIAGVLYTMVYMLGILIWSEYNDMHISVILIELILAVLFLIFTVILIYKHFQWYMMKELVLQFRVNMLISCILILIYSSIQQLIWTDSNDLNAKFVIQTIINKMVYVIACLLAIIRDGLNISYPNYFIILSSILLSFVSCWNVFLFSFGLDSVKYPAWFTLIVKQAYFQVIVVLYLWIYYLWRDRDGKYFSLIRKRRATHELWGDTDPMYNVRESFDISTTGSVSNNDCISGYDLHQKL